MDGKVASVLPVIKKQVVIFDTPFGRHETAFPVAVSAR